LSELGLSILFCRYFPFDFHELSKGDIFENLKIKIKELSDDISDSLFYWRGPGGVEILTQRGAFRVNCMDCLDRTNVTQRIIAREILNMQLMKLGIKGNAGLGVDAEFDQHFNFGELLIIIIIILILMIILIIIFIYLSMSLDGQWRRY